MNYSKYYIKVFNVKESVFWSKFMSLTLNEEILLYNKIYFYINEKIEVISEIKNFSIAKIKINRTGKKIYVDRKQIKEYIDNSYYITPKIYKRNFI
jgi:hypothetical protein